MVIKPNCHNLHDFQLILVYVQRIAQTSLRIFLQAKVKVDGAKFSSHDRGIFKSQLLKMATERKMHISL